MNFYEKLNLSPGATNEEIKKQYRKLSMKYHPDRNKDPDATKKFQEINEAFEYLTKNKNTNIFENLNSPGMKANFAADDLFNTIFKNIAEDLNNKMFDISLDDEELINHLQNHSPMGMPFPIPMSNIFSNMPFPTMKNMKSMKSMKPKQQPINVEPLIKEVIITLDQSYNGDNIPIKIERNILENNRSRSEIETIYINIQKGIDNDEIINLEGKGNIVNNKKGDVSLLIKINNDTNFKREGLNLFITKNITFKESFCGFNFSIDHINGKSYKLNNKEGNIIKSESQKIIPKLGMIRGDNTGNLIIKFNIIYPEIISKDQIEIIKKYF
jgi:DnaJ-class molecular chaperone